MRSPEDSRGISRISAPPRERTVAPVHPKPKTDLTPASPNREKQPQKGKKSWIKRLTGNLGVRVGLGFLALGGAGYGVLEADRNELINIPGIHQSIETIPDKFLNTNDTGVIGINNISVVPPEKIVELPSFDEKGQPLLLFPISNLQPGETIKFKKEFTGNIVSTAWSNEIADKAKIENTRDRFNLENVQAGKVFVSLIDGKVFILAAVRNEEVIPIGARIEFMSPNDTKYLLLIGADFPRGTGIQKALNMLIDAPVVGPNNPKEGLPIQKGTPIFTTTQAVDIGFSLQGGLGGNLDPQFRIPGNIDFLTDSLSSKLLVSQ